MPKVYISSRLTTDGLNKHDLNSSDSSLDRTIYLGFSPLPLDELVEKAFLTLKNSIPPELKSLLENIPLDDYIYGMNTDKLFDVIRENLKADVMLKPEAKTEAHLTLIVQRISVHAMRHYRYATGLKIDHA